jgi:hypothetical protein
MALGRRGELAIVLLAGQSIVDSDISREAAHPFWRVIGQHGCLNFIGRITGPAFAVLWPDALNKG